MCVYGAKYEKQAMKMISFNMGRLAHIGNILAFHRLDPARK